MKQDTYCKDCIKFSSKDCTCRAKAPLLNTMRYDDKGKIYYKGVWPRIDPDNDYCFEMETNRFD